MTDPDLTYLSLIVDRSGSMASVAGEMNGAIKAFLDNQDRQPGRLRVDVTTFDDIIKLKADGIPAAEIRHPLIKPRGATALYDAMGSAIQHLGAKLADTPEEARPGTVIVLVVTDGAENASVEWTGEKVRALVEQQTTVYGWQFVFLGANIDSRTVGGNLGFAPDSTMDWDANADGVAAALGALDAYSSSARAGAPAAFTAEQRDASAPSRRRSR